MDKNGKSVYQIPLRDKFNIKTAILVDGGFYRLRAKKLAGEKSPKDRADELERYCLDHLHHKYEKRALYRIFIMIVHLLKKAQMFIIPLQKGLKT